MSSTTHAAPRSRRFTRKALIVMVVTGLVVLGSAAAFAAYLLRVQAGGQLASKNIVYSWNAGSITTTKSAPDMTCTATVNGPTLQFDVQGWPGDECTIRATATFPNTTNNAVKVAGFDLGTLPEEWAVRLDPASDCGTAIGGADATTKPLGFKIRVGTGAPTGVAVDAAGHGWQIIPATQWTQANQDQCVAETAAYGG